VSVVVLDEADRMLDMGFRDDIDYILARTSKNCQISLFSATIDSSVTEISRKYIADPEKISVSKDEIALKQMTQLYTVVNPREKFDVLCKLINEKSIKRAIVFCRTREGASRLADKLRYYGYDAEAIHADLSQAQREAIVEAFRNERIQLLVATDVMARGLDIKDVTHVLNYNVPFDALMYFHRIGRTARVGKDGTAITLVAYGELSEFERIQSLTKTRIDRIEIE
jgi:ATP-dependent RNA helicase DeaD